MGFFGGGEQDSTRSASDELIDRQFTQNQAEIQDKKQRLYQERLDIIKSQGGNNWTPRR